MCIHASPYNGKEGLGEDGAVVEDGLRIEVRTLKMGLRGEVG